MKNFALLLFVIIAYIGCSKKSHIEDMKTLNVGDVIFDESTRELRTKSGAVLDVQKYKDANIAFVATSLEIISSAKSMSGINEDYCYTCGYRVEIDHHVWWGADAYDIGGHIGIHSGMGYFIFRPGNLYMHTGVFIYRGTDCDSIFFLQNSISDDPTNSIIRLDEPNCTGPLLLYNAGGGI